MTIRTVSSTERNKDLSGDSISDPETFQPCDCGQMPDVVTLDSLNRFQKLWLCAMLMLLAMDPSWYQCWLRAFMESLYLLRCVSRIPVLQQISLHISGYKSLDGFINVWGVRETFLSLIHCQSTTKYFRAILFLLLHWVQFRGQLKELKVFLWL